MTEARMTPLPYCTGTGGEGDPFVSGSGTAGIAEALAALEEHGGLLRLPAARYEIERTLLFGLSSSRISGDVWGYSSDPNGVFEGMHGVKLRLKGVGHAAIRVGKDRTLGGNMITDLGIQGDLVGMDTRSRFSLLEPGANAGILFDAVRTDQCAYRKLSFCGLGVAVAATGEAELDACRFDDCNTDGCAVGVYFSPRASYYAQIHRCIFADNPYWGVYVDGRGKFIHNLEVNECSFVRNGGGFSEDALPRPAALTMLGVSSCAVERNVFDDPGTFWYYDTTDGKNEQRKPQKQPMPAVILEGRGNRVRDNLFSRCKGAALIVSGDGNVLMNNITDGDVILSGNGCYVSGLALRGDARLILRGADDAEIYGVPEEKIVRE